jgi:hypothetical protein
MQEPSSIQIAAINRRWNQQSITNLRENEEKIEEFITDIKSAIEDPETLSPFLFSAKDGFLLQEKCLFLAKILGFKELLNRLNLNN